METNSFASVGTATLDARARLVDAGREPVRDERHMAQIGEDALFEEALLNALHAQVSEIKAVAR